jgi:hypothetical protein
MKHFRRRALEPTAIAIPADITKGVRTAYQFAASSLAPHWLFRLMYIQTGSVSVAGRRVTSRR